MTPWRYADPGHERRNCVMGCGRRGAGLLSRTMRLTMLVVFWFAAAPLMAPNVLAQSTGAWPEVNLANANVVVDRTELRLYWAGPPMELRRVYNSRSHADGPPRSSRGSERHATTVTEKRPM